MSIKKRLNVFLSARIAGSVLCCCLVVLFQVIFPCRTTRRNPNNRLGSMILLALLTVQRNEKRAKPSRSFALFYIKEVFFKLKNVICLFYDDFLTISHINARCGWLAGESETVEVVPDDIVVVG